MQSTKTNNFVTTCRPRRYRQSSLNRASPATSQSCEQLTSSSSNSKPASPEKSLYSLPERLSESSDHLDTSKIELTSRRCRSCEGILEAEEMHTQLSLPTPLDAATQTKRKKNFMDRCVNKVRLWWRLVVIKHVLAVCVGIWTALLDSKSLYVNIVLKYKSAHNVYIFCVCHILRTENWFSNIL